MYLYINEVMFHKDIHVLSKYYFKDVYIITYWKFNNYFNTYGMMFKFIEKGFNTEAVRFKMRLNIKLK